MYILRNVFLRICEYAPKAEGRISRKEEKGRKKIEEKFVGLNRNLISRKMLFK